jgi:glycosyltransferase involved in cell wall biosynthesis
MRRRILYIHGISEIGGAEQDLLRLLERIDRQEFEPFVVCPPGGPLIKELEERKVQVYPINLPPWRQLKGIIRIPFAVRSLYKLMLELRINLVHVNDFWWGPVSYMASRMADVPCVVHIRQEIEPRRVRQYWFKKPHGMIAVSNRIRDVAVEAGVDPVKIKVIYSGIDPAVNANSTDRTRVREQYRLTSSQAVIGTVANLFPRKGYEYLIDALVPIQKKIHDIHCLIVGEGDAQYHQMILDRVESNGLKRNVTFTGFQREVPAHILAMDVFVLPSVMEGFGIVLLEAMAMEKPVVATTVGGIPEIVEDSVTGFLVPPRDSDGLAQKIIYLLENQMVRERLGKLGRKRVVELFTANRTVLQIQALYNELIM